MKQSIKLLSVIVPCYNEELVIDETIKQLQKLSKKQIDHARDTELIFVDDGSSDETRSKIKAHGQLDSSIKLIGFSRNFGQQRAISAGMEAAKGDAVAMIDADLQDPPEVIHDMLEQLITGDDVVYGVRMDRQGESTFKRITSKLFYRFIRWISDIDIPIDTGDFRVMSRRAVDVFNQMPEQDRFIRGMATWVGFKQTAFPYERKSRYAGTTKFFLSDMMGMATDGILSFSNKPLKIAYVFGSILMLVSFLCIGAFFIRCLLLGMASWPYIWCALFSFVAGLQFFTMGLIGEYISRIYQQSKNRPLYVVEETFNF